ncbi:PorT family protein [Hymenobacter aerilatus]|uniref:PorT family protein n=1 Tax=Hymenobacter aerilatus TaxID=2932251 RepID=A0A8T9SU94_9BACT|nr:porin family protein [Hymenobacter aerilatus]UOR04544.1 PorT family protein [Hymenobacter aerilatus]
MMRKYIASIVLGACSLAGATAHAQVSGTRLGLRVGLNSATLSGTINSEPRACVGPVFGTVVRFKPSSQGFAVQSELQLSFQGVKTTGTRNTSGQPHTASRRISYLNVPVLLRQYIGKHVYVNVGPQLGIMLGASDSGSASFQKLEAGAVGGVGVEFVSGFFLDVRYNYGLTDINRDPDERQFRQQLSIGGLYNRVAQFSLGYLFGVKDK